MPLIRKAARQGHAIPNGYTRPLGPFPPEIFAQNPRAYDETFESDSLPESFDDVRMFRCKFCTDILYEDELRTHDCDEEEE
jgi:hypothetical protein